MRALATRKRKLVALLGVLGLLAVCLVPFSTAVTDRDRERAVSHALRALIEDRIVLTSRGPSRLLECDSVRDEGRLYFENGLGIPDAVFLTHGLKPIPRDKKLDVDKGDVIIGFLYHDIDGKPMEQIQFYYSFGSLAGHVYEIRIYRSLLTRYFVYIHRWVA